MPENPERKHLSDDHFKLQFPSETSSLTQDAALDGFHAATGEGLILEAAEEDDLEGGGEHPVHIGLVATYGEGTSALEKTIQPCAMHVHGATGTKVDDAAFAFAEQAFLEPVEIYGLLTIAHVEDARVTMKAEVEQGVVGIAFLRPFAEVVFQLTCGADVTPDEADDGLVGSGEEIKHREHGGGRAEVTLPIAFEAKDTAVGMSGHGVVWPILTQ